MILAPNVLILTTPFSLIQSCLPTPPCHHIQCLISSAYTVPCLLYLFFLVITSLCVLNIGICPLPLYMMEISKAVFMA
jgi:hypothetical protein